MAYITDSLAPDETVEEIFKLHWSSRTTLWLWTLLIIPTIGIAIIPAIYEWLRLRCLEQGVTNKRVILKRGIIALKTDEMRLTSIENVEIIQSVFGRLLGYGTITVTGRGLSDVVFKNIDEPMDVKRSIEKADIEAKALSTDEDSDEEPQANTKS